MNLMPFFNQWVMRPWQWGESDCCQFVGAYIEHLTGINPARQFLYSDEDGAFAVINEYGGLQNLVTHFLGEPTSKGRHGMVAMVGRPQLMGVVYRDRIVARTPGDINDIPLSRGVAFWSVSRG